MLTSPITRVSLAAVAIAAAIASACGSQAPTSPTSSGGVHTVVSMVMLEATGPNPREITAGLGETVSFMNHESVPYTVAGGAGPAQTACSELNAIGVLRPGEVRSTEPFSAPKICDYHVPNGQAVLFTGRIIIR